MDFILEMLQMIRDLLCKCPFPSTWQQMIMLQNKTVHKALRFLMNAIQGHFSNERESFYSDVWQEYMLTAVCFVTQPSLQPSEEWLRDEGDSRIQLRKGTARDLRSMWFRLTPVQKMVYIPRLVGAFLKVALVEDDETREATIPIFFDMMQCEFHSCVEDRKNFKKASIARFHFFPVIVALLYLEGEKMPAFNLAYTHRVVPSCFSFFFALALEFE
ncbi:hypothetical protein COOONC_17801 [Cooperia oncophora]